MAASQITEPPMIKKESTMVKTVHTKKKQMIYDRVWVIEGMKGMNSWQSNAF